MKELIYVAVVAAGAVLGSGCSSSSSNSSDGGGGGAQFGVSPASDLLSAPAGAGGTWKVKWYMDISMENNDQGQQITVHKGDSVIWVSTDGAPHSVVPTNANQTGAFTATSNFTTQSTPISFPTAGTWGYFCGVHGASSMSGTITVQ